MISAIYNVVINLYWIIILIVANFNKKAALFASGRKTMPINFNPSKKEVIWFHCASLGEFEQGRPVIEAFKNNFPDIAILLTFFSPSGYEIRKDYAYADLVCYLPMDTPGKALKFIELVNPSLCVFVKYEFWHNYLRILQQKAIPIISISTIFREEQIFFKNYGGFFRKLLSRFDHLFVQNEASSKLLKSIQINNVTTTGDTRFDRVLQLCNRVKPIQFIEEFKAGNSLMVIGSSWPEDMEYLIPFINAHAQMKFIIAPHEITPSHLTKIESGINGKTLRYSTLDPATVNNAQVLIIDNVGMLSSLYQYGEFAYIGGAFGKGLHNILEAATFGLPIFFGNKNFNKFQEAVDLVNLGGAFTIKNEKELVTKFKKLGESAVWQQASDISKNYVTSNTGATTTIVEFCKNNFINEG